MKVFFKMNEQVTAGVLAEMCGGMLRQEHLSGVRVCEIGTDSREADKDTVFAALRGEHTDGHDYIDSALQNGCRCIICERSNEAVESAGVAAIVVNDTELALSRLANSYRRMLPCKVAAVTGSVGKTTTKDMIAAVLSERFGEKVYKTPGNHNSVIGMPLSMLEIPQDTEWSVLEMGMSGFGEIERLSMTAEPDIGIITNIGTSHMEKLGSRENICRAKLEILCGLKDGGTLILNGDEPLLRNVKGKNYRTFYVSLKDSSADFSAQNIRVETDCTTFDVKWNGKVYSDLSVRVMGRHNVYAALNAFAVGVLSGMTPDAVRAGLLRFAPEGMRQNRYSIGGITVIEDCYNASPESMIAAIDVLDDYCRKTGGRSFAVLGDMLELGNSSPELHRNVGCHLAEHQIGELFTFGQGSGQIAVGARQRNMSNDRIHRHPDANNVEEIGEELYSKLADGDVVLFKASRAMGAERLIDYLRARMSR